MKTLNYMVAIAAASTLAMASCNNKTKDTQPAELEDILEKSTVTVAQNSLTDTLLTLGKQQMKFAQLSRIFQVDTAGQFYLSVRTIIPAGTSPITDNLYNKIIDYYNQLGDTINNVPSSASTPAGLAQAIDNMGEKFEKYVKPYANDTLTPGFMMNIDLRPVYGTDRYVTYSIYDDYYTGGAHGEIDSYFTTYNIADGRPYTFDTMFKADSHNAIRAKLVDIIAKDKGLTVDEYLKSLNEFIMPATPVTINNFPVYHVGITSMGVVFTYPKYSIAAGFEGCPSYVIPFDEAASYLTL